MYHGGYTWQFQDVAACSWNLPAGTQLLFWDGRVVTCRDRGLLGSVGWVDIHCRGSTYYCVNTIEAAYGQYTVVTVLRWGWGY